MSRAVASIILALVLPGITAALRAQTPAGANGGATLPSQIPGGPTRLKDFRETYRQELKKIHEPLLNNYLASLQLLARSSPAAEQPAIQEEIARVQKLIAGGAVLDLAVVSAALNAPDKAGSMPRTMPAGVEIAGALVLSAAQATGFTATGVVPETLALGSGSWPVTALPAGSYDVLVQYACTSLAEGARLKATLGSIESEVVLNPERVTRTILDFRVLRIGRLQVAAPLVNETLTLELLPASAGTLRVQRVILAAKGKAVGK